MQTIVLLATLVAAALAIPSDTYDPKYDDFNAQEVAKNKHMLSHYGKCFVGEGPCPPEGSDFKKKIPEALKSNCGKCTPKQRELIRIIVRAMRKEMPEIWAKLEKQQDPNGEFKESFNAFLNADN